MAPPAWTCPADVREAVSKKWATILAAYATGQEWVPRDFPLRGPGPAEIGERLGEVQKWAGEWEQAARGPLRVEYKKVGGRHIGANLIPGRAWVDGYEQAWALLGAAGEIRRLADLTEQTKASCPRLVTWLTSHPVRALDLASRPDIMLGPVSQADLKRRAEAAAAAALARQKSVTPIDVCVGIGWLHTSNVEDWRRGRVDDLEYFLPVHDDRLIDLMLYVHQWAEEHGLTRTETDYVSATRDRHPLRFFTNGDPLEEAAWRSQWVSADVSAAQRERIVKRQAAPPDLIVVQPVKDWTCAECGGTGDLLIMDGKGPLCLTCADLDHLVFLPSGDAALTRRAKKASLLAAVVVRWSKARKRYERQGLLVEEPALEQAEQQCLARLFPGCPAGRAQAIARHTSLRSSGRVGRSAAGRSLDDKAVTLAVVASVRHEDTEYDSLLMSGVPREAARDQIRPDIDRVLNAWA